MTRKPAKFGLPVRSFTQTKLPRTIRIARTSQTNLLEVIEVLKSYSKADLAVQSSESSYFSICVG